MPRKASSKPADSTANLGFEAKLWLAADKLRNNMDAAEYKHVVLGLIFVKYISDSFEEHRAKLLAGEGDFAGANPEDKDEYLAANVFWVPKEARWAHLQANAKLPSIGKDVDDAMVALERDNPRLKGALNKNYGRADLDKHRLGELIDLIGSIQLADVASRSKDLLGRVFEYFLTQFASAEGKNGGQFYTPSCVVRLLVEMLAPYKGRIYDPACGSGGSLPAQSRLRRIRFAAQDRAIAPGGVQSRGQDKWARRQRPFGLAPRARRVRLRRQQPKQSNPTTRRLAIMNLALRGIEADFGPENADTFRRDLHPDLRADYVLANPPFNDSDWFRKDDDVRWQPSGARQIAKGNPQGERGGAHQFGVPPKGNANFAWVQHFIHHLAPQGMAGFVLTKGSMSSNESGDCPARSAMKTPKAKPQSLPRQREIRQKLIEPDLVDCMVALSGQLFYCTLIPVCLWFLAKERRGREPISPLACCHAQHTTVNLCSN